MALGYDMAQVVVQEWLIARRAKVNLRNRKTSRNGPGGIIVFCVGAIGQQQKLRIGKNDNLLHCTLIFNHRNNQNLSQVGLAQLAGVSPVTVFSIEAGKTDVRVGTLAKIAEALGLRLDVAFREGNGNGKKTN